MSEVFFYIEVIDPMVFQSMMREEDIKNHFKEKMAYELAKTLVRTNRAKFTYSKDNFKDQYTLKAEIKL